MRTIEGSGWEHLFPRFEVELDVERAPKRQRGSAEQQGAADPEQALLRFQHAVYGQLLPPLDDPHNWADDGG